MAKIQPPAPNPQAPKLVSIETLLATPPRYAVQERPTVCRSCGTEMPGLKPHQDRICDVCFEAQDEIDELAYFYAQPFTRDDVSGWVEKVFIPIDLADFIDLGQEGGSYQLGVEDAEERLADAERWADEIGEKLGLDDGWEIPQEVLDAQPGRTSILAAIEAERAIEEGTAGKDGAAPSVDLSPAMPGPAEEVQPAVEEPSPPVSPPGWCPHGMPSQASCVECMEEGPIQLQQLKATRFQQARYETACERAICTNTINPGDMIGYVDGVGWCCRSCTVPRR